MVDFVAVLQEFYQQITDALTNLLGPFGPLMAVGMLGVLLILLTLPVLMRKQVDPLDKLKQTNAGVTAKNDKTNKLRAPSSKDKLEKYSNFLEPQDADEYSAVKLKLLQAGYRSQNAIRIFYFLQFTLGIVGLILGFVYVFFIVNDPQMPIETLVLYIMGPGAVGYLTPKYWVERRKQERQKAIENGFPDSLDMMLVCVEAGQSLDQAILRVSQELRTGFPDLSEEYQMISLETKAGKDKTTVLKDMAERCGVPDISSFVSVLVQSTQFGTSIADALRVYSDEMRDKRVMRAEEKANKLPTKMTLATMMLTVPPLMMILIGPSIYAIVQNLG